MKVRILGCGTSGGVPRVGSGWGECDPNEPRNRRLRSSILFESGGERLLVDCGPDLRQQLLDGEIHAIDALIVTHDHADHCHGIDELRPLAQALGKALPIFGREKTLAQMQSRFEYAFVQAGLYPPVVEPMQLVEPWEFGESVLRFVDQPHGGITSLGIRFDESGKSIAYAIDFHDLTEDMAKLYEGVDVWICDCLMRHPHPTHAHLDAVLGWARDLKVGALYLSHMGSGLDYRTLVNELPDWAAPGHDGLEIAL